MAQNRITRKTKFPDNLIQDVQVKELRRISDDRGYLMEMLRSDWPEFEAFAQSYVTACYPGAVKAWRYHKKQWDHFVCVQGIARVALYDPRKNSSSKGSVNEFRLDASPPVLMKIPPFVYHDFSAEGGQTTLIVNFPTELYNYENPDEYRVPYDDPSIPYDWNVRRE